MFFKRTPKGKQEKTPTPKRRSATPGKEGGEKISLLADLTVLTLLTVDLYLLGSLMTPWTGDLGLAVSQSILSHAGGAAIIPLLFGAYALLGRLIRRKIERPYPQLLGTSVLFLCTALALGLKSLTGNPMSLRWLSPGRWGVGLTFFLYRSVGPLGTILTGLFCAFLALILFRPQVLIHLRVLPHKLLSSAKNWASRFKRAEGKRATNREKLPTEQPAPEPEVFLSAEEETPESPTRVFRRRPSSDETVAETAMTSEAPSGDQGLGFWEAPIPDGEDHLQELFRKDEQGPLLYEEPTPQGQFPPPLDLFGPEESFVDPLDHELIRKQGERIIQTLAEFGIEAEMAEKVVGPTVVQFRIQLAPGIKVSRVASLNNDLAVALAVPSLRVEAPIPGKPYVGIEIPNPKRVPVSLRSVIESPQFDEGESDLPLPLGQGVDGKPLVVGLEDLPHILVAGTTGSGKSVFVNSCILGLCSKRRPEELRLLLVDPKRVEMSFYEKLPHTLTPPIVDPKKAVQALAWAIREMERRYEVFARSRVRNLEGYNAKTLPKDRFPHIVIVVDELADLMMTSPKEVEDYICRLAQMARATGIHLMVATQRPSVNVITGLIKANIPARVAFTLPSQADSRTILDVSGAEKLLGKGDMLFLSPRYPKPLRIQSPWIDEGRLSALISYLVDLFGEPEHIEIEEQGGSNGNLDDPQLEDPLIRQAVHSVLETGIASASRLQRQLRVGFTRAARLVDAMETLGIVGPQEGSKPREILVDEDRAEEILTRLDEGEIG